MVITATEAYVHGITERPVDNHDKAIIARYEDTVRLLMQIKGPVKTMRMLSDSIAKLARAELANREDN